MPRYSIGSTGDGGQGETGQITPATLSSALALGKAKDYDFVRFLHVPLG